MGSSVGVATRTTPPATADEATLRNVEGLLSPWHLLIVLIVALLVFGPSKLPEIGGQLGRGIREFRRFQSSVRDDVGGFLDHDEEPPSQTAESPPDHEPEAGEPTDRKPPAAPSE